MNKDDLIEFLTWLENISALTNPLQFPDKERLAKGYLDSERYKEFKRRQKYGTRRR